MKVTFTYTEAGGEDFSHYEVTAVYDAPNIVAEDMPDIREACKTILKPREVFKEIDSLVPHIEVEREVTIFYRNGRIISVLSYQTEKRPLFDSEASRIAQDSLKTLAQLCSVLDVFN